MANREIQFRCYGSYTIWIEDIPEKFQYQAGEILEQRIKVPANVEPMLKQPRHIGIRFVRVGDGGANFGVLGADFIPGNSDDLVIQVLVSRQAAAWESAWAGLSKQYAQTTLDEAAKNLQQTDVLGRGTLQFDRAAEHPVDSAPIIYQQLVRAIVALMDPIIDDLPDEKIGMIVGKAIWPERTEEEIQTAMAESDHRQFN